MSVSAALRPRSLLALFVELFSIFRTLLFKLEDVGHNGFRTPYHGFSINIDLVNASIFFLSRSFGGSSNWVAKISTITTTIFSSNIGTALNKSPRDFLPSAEFVIITMQSLVSSERFRKRRLRL
ncbi:hypothetical protein HAX54_028756 [Datura stramonium]|uniref:Uncharacterized protein n=1 Tax=Datura stramonium TaxID=4076 RepID=A0ABS8S9T3_DATST|nr:hypothetical protein [Datura stramonium]